MMTAIDFAKQAQAYHYQSPTIILGSGASAAHGLSGMWQLAQHLMSTVATTGLASHEVDSWDAFCNLLKSDIDLESALHQIRLSDALTSRVVRATWDLLNPEDCSLHNECLTDKNKLPLGKLLKLLFRSTASKIEIITTNYDRIAEYASEQEGFHHYSGFSHGYSRRLCQDTDLICKRVVKIWKVHGSLDWCRNQSGEIVGIGNQVGLPPAFSPLIVTPGNEKYRMTHTLPFRDIISSADRSIENADSYLCIGFGFNDAHIQEKLIEKCVRKNASITVIARELTDSAKGFLLSAGVENYLAVEMADVETRSRVFSSLGPSEFEIDGDHWSLPGYLRLIE